MNGLPRLALDIAVERFAYAKPFRISGHVFTESEVVVVTLSQENHRGRGEASGIYYLGDDITSMTTAIESVRADVEQGIVREDLQDLLPAGGARNALDCALWDLEAKRAGLPVWKLAGVLKPRPLLTTFTLGADRPEAMAEGAKAFAEARALKLKLTGEIGLDIERVEAVRAARPDCWLAVDANQGFEVAELDRLVAGLLAADVKLVEQPLARGREADLDGYRSAIPIAADESVLTQADLPAMAGRFDIVNIKLDKSGGLTEALQMVSLARSFGLGVMVGNMVGTSLAMAPAFVLGQLCDIVDLDGPTFLARDREPAITYSGGNAWCDDTVWGS